MSKNLQDNNSSEEVDLGQLFKAIGNLFDRFIGFISLVFKSIFSYIIFLLKPLVKNIKIISILLVTSSLIGYGLERMKEDTYSSQMIVRPYFDSKYQLVTNINYYNALIQEKDYDQLKGIFNLSYENAKEILNFEINPGPETENDKLIQYEKFIQGIDSSRAISIEYDDFIDNRSIYNGDKFEIEVISTKKDIFRSLENGLNSTFTNTYSVKKMQKRDSLISIEKSRVISALKEVDSLKKVYIEVMKEESRSNESSSVLTKDGMSLIKEKTNTREYELLEKQIKLRQELSALESKKVEEDVFFDTISSFQDVGTKHKDILDRYIIVFPVFVFLLLILGYFFIKLFKFINEYE